MYLSILSISISIYQYPYLSIYQSIHSYPILSIHLSIYLSYRIDLVLLFDKPSAPLSQPYNMFFGHVLGSIVGVSIRLAGQAAHVDNYILAPLSVATTVFVMDITRCTHPPGAGTAMIAIMGGPAIWALDYHYVVTNIGASIVFIIWACIGNNLSSSRNYPMYWLPMEIEKKEGVK